MSARNDLRGYQASASRVLRYPAEHMLGSFFVVAAITAAFAYFGITEFFGADSGYVLRWVGPGFLPLLAAGLTASYLMAWQPPRGSAGYVLLAGFVALGAAGVAVQNHAGTNFVAGMGALGALILVRSAIVSYRRRVGIRAGHHETLHFNVFAIWLTASLFVLDPLFSLRTAVVAVMLVWITGLGDWLDQLSDLLNRWLNGAAAPAQEPVDDGSSSEPEAPSSGLSAEDERIISRIREFIAANYANWTDPVFGTPIDSARYKIYPVKQPLNIKGGIFLDRSDDVAAAIGIKKSMVIISQDENGFQVELAKKEPRILHFDDAMDAWADQLKGPLEVIVGESPYREPIITRLDAQASPHTLVAGTTGSGKSIWLHTTLNQILRRNSPDDLKVLWADAGRTTAEPYARIPHLWRPVSLDHLEMVAQLRELREEREKRSHLFVEHHAQSLTDLHTKTGIKLPLILVLIDEAASLTDSMDVDNVAKPFKDLLRNLLENSRKFGIYIVLGVQRPMVDTLGKGVRDLLSRRIVFKLLAPAHSELILEDGDRRAAKLRGYGDGIYKQADVERFQAMFVADKPEERVGDHPGLDQIISETIELWGGPNNFVDQKQMAENQRRAAAEFAAEHIAGIDDTSWAVLRGLERGFAKVTREFEMKEWSPETLLPFVLRVLPEFHPLIEKINEARVAGAMSKLFDDNREQRWPLVREQVDTMVASYRAISERDMRVITGLIEYMRDNPVKPAELRADRLLRYVNRPVGDEPLSDPHTAVEIDAALDRYIGAFSLSAAKWKRARAVAEEYLNRPIEAAAADAGPARPTSSLDDIANRRSVG